MSKVGYTYLAPESLGGIPDDQHHCRRDVLPGAPSSRKHHGSRMMGPCRHSHHAAGRTMLHSDSTGSTHAMINGGGTI